MYIYNLYYYAYILQIHSGARKLITFSGINFSAKPCHTNLNKYFENTFQTSPYNTKHAPKYDCSEN